MRIGTLRCLLWGHKFLLTEYKEISVKYTPSNFCVRCGFTKKELYGHNKEKRESKDKQ